MTAMTAAALSSIVALCCGCYLIGILEGRRRMRADAILQLDALISATEIVARACHPDGIPAKGVLVNLHRIRIEL